MKRHYRAPLSTPIQFDLQEFIAISGGDIHGPGTAPPVDDPSEWDSRKKDYFKDMFHFEW